MPSNRIEFNTIAPDFALKDFNDRLVRLSDYRGKKNVVLVFNRGFT
jgi:peroxiredoxin